MSSKDSAVYLAHARDCISRIHAYTTEGRVSLDDPKTQDAVIRNLEVIGQCFKDANVALMEESYPEIPWRDVAAFRNVLAHEYMGVNINVVWNIIEKHLPPLFDQLDAILRQWTP